MAQRIEAFGVSVPRSTTKAAPQTTALTFPEGVVEVVEVIIPTGHIGQTGFRLRYASQQVIPDTAGAWIVSSGEVIRWPLDGFPTGAQWACQAYNLDPAHAHAFYFRFLVNELVAPNEPGGLVVPVQVV